MTIIVYGKNKEIFEVDNASIPYSIIALYEYCGGRMGKELFSKIINGLVDAGTIKDMVDVFDHVSCEHPIVKIYSCADRYFDSEDFEDGNGQ